MMVYRGKIIIVLIISLLTAFPLVAQVTADVNLAGYNHSPIVRTPAIGFMQVAFENDSLYVEGEFTDLRGFYWASFIQYGEPGKSGHRLFRLRPELGVDNIIPKVENLLKKLRDPFTES